MKPISLTIEAFGPYRDSVTLDFSELENHSMFLISGPTGAGKNIHFRCYGVRLIW